MRPPDEVDGRGRARLVHRHRRRPVARDPCRSPSASASASPSAARTSSTVWCSSTSRSPPASELEVEAGVERPEREQVVEEPDARLAAGAARAVEVERQRAAPSRCSCGRRTPCGRARERRAAPSAASRTSFSRGRRSVIRMPPLTTRTTSPCSSRRRAERLVGAEEDEVAVALRAVVPGRDERGAHAFPLGDRRPRRRCAARAARRRRSGRPDR